MTWKHALPVRGGAAVWGGGSIGVAEKAELESHWWGCEGCTVWLLCAWSYQFQAKDKKNDMIHCDSKKTKEWPQICVFSDSRIVIDDKREGYRTEDI